MEPMKKMELLAPAGDLEKLKIACVYGADAVYFGGEMFSLRAGAGNMTIEEMKAFVLSHMAKHKVPKYVDFVDSFPMNAAGKILKYKMREEAQKKFCPA